MNKELENLKKEYNDIPIPKELKSRVEQVVRTGREEEKKQQRRSKKRKQWKFFRSAATVSAAAALCIIVLANSSAETAYALENMPIIGAFSQVVTFRTFEDRQGDYEAKINTPKVKEEEGEKKHLKEGKENLNKTMEEYTAEIKKAYESDIKAAGGVGKEAVNTDYKVLIDDERLLSIRIDTSITMAGSNSFTEIYHLDKITGLQVSLKDFFREDSEYLTKLSEDLIRQMKKANDEEGAAYFLDSEYGVENMFTRLSPEQNFYWTKEGNLVFVFDKYQVSAGYMGMPELVVERSVFENDLKEEWK